MMTKEREYPLEHYVDELRRPRRLHVMQKSAFVSVKQEGLLDLLRQAQVGGIGSHAGGSSGSERIPFNDNARNLLERITRAIANAYHQLRPTVPMIALELLEPEQVLTDWYTTLTDDIASGALSQDAEESARLRAKRWVKQVEEFFDPAVPREYTVPCPECGNRFAYDRSTGDQVSAMVLFYKPENADRPREVLYAECRFCEEKWIGVSGVQQLMRLLADDDMVEAVVADDTPDD